METFEIHATLKLRTGDGAAAAHLLKRFAQSVVHEDIGEFTITLMNNTGYPIQTISREVPNGR